MPEVEVTLYQGKFSHGTCSTSVEEDRDKWAKLVRKSFGKDIEIELSERQITVWQEPDKEVKARKEDES